jgi:hypothetical protein
MEENLKVDDFVLISPSNILCQESIQLTCWLYLNLPKNDIHCWVRCIKKTKSHSKQARVNKKPVSCISITVHVVPTEWGKRTRGALFWHRWKKSMAPRRGMQEKIMFAARMLPAHTHHARNTATDKIHSLLSLVVSRTEQKNSTMDVVKSD